MKKFNKPKLSVCQSDPGLNPVLFFFYSITSFKICRILSRFDFKVFFTPLNKINFSSPKVPILIEFLCGI